MTDHFAALAAADPERAQAILAKVAKRLIIPHHGGQDQVARSTARFRTLRAGRRWGKSKFGAREVVLNAIKAPEQMVWVVANTYKNTRRNYREVVRQLPPELLAKPAPPSTSNELILQLKGGSVIEFYSGGNPDAMAGEGVDFVLLDEAALMPEHVWQQIIRPALMDTGGGALIISTPRGRNWFWKLWQRGQDPRSKQYDSWHFPTSSSPYVDAEEIEDAKASMPERLYNQEILAEFISNADAIFNLSKSLIIPDYALAVPEGHISMGVDLAKHQDFSVIRATRGDDGMPVYHERFKNVSWPEQRERIMEAADLMIEQGGDGVTIGLDSTGLGDVIFDDLDEAGYDVEPIKISNQWKYKAVKLLGAAIEQQEHILLESTVPEFESFEYTITAHGNMTYQAAEGSHDDEVSAAMLEHWVRHHGSPGTVTVENVWEVDQAAEEERIVKPRTTVDLINDPAVWSPA